MSIYIEGMAMPKAEFGSMIVAIRPDGMVEDVMVGCYVGKAVHVPPHGRLIDEREINSRFDNGIKTISELPFPNDFVELYKQLATEVKEEIGKCHTIIPASKEE